MNLASHWTIAAVADLGGCSATIVRRADDVLQPDRDSSGRRLYDPAKVAEWIARRAARRSSK